MYIEDGKREVQQWRGMVAWWWMREEMKIKERMLACARKKKSGSVVSLLATKLKKVEKQ